MLEFDWGRPEIKEYPVLRQAENLISLVERVMHNRFCDRNLLKTGRTFFQENSRASVRNQNPLSFSQLNLNRAN
jgi:hypothetical protein